MPKKTAQLIVDAYQHHDPTNQLKSIYYVDKNGTLMLQSRHETSEIIGAMEFEASEKSLLQLPANCIAIDFMYKQINEVE